MIPSLHGPRVPPAPRILALISPPTGTVAAVDLFSVMWSKSIKNDIFYNGAIDCDPLRYRKGAFEIRRHLK